MRAAAPTAGSAGEAACFLLGFCRQSPHRKLREPRSTELKGQLPCRTTGQHCHCSGSGRQNIRPKRIILESSLLMKFPLLGFRLASGLPSLPFFLFLPVRTGMSILCLSIMVFLTHITCLVLQTYGWRRILPQHELYIKFHPYLIK